MSFLKNISKRQIIFLAINLGAAIALLLLFSLFEAMRNFYVASFLMFLLISIFVFLVNEIFKKETNFKESKFKLINKIQNGLKTNSQKILAFCRVFGAIVVLLLTARTIGGHDYFEYVEALNSEFMSEVEVGFGIIFGQLYTGILILVAVAQFINSKIFSLIVKFIVTPILIICTILMPYIVMGIVGNIYGVKEYDPFNFRMILMGLEYGIVVALVLKEWLINSEFKFPKEFIGTFFTTLFILILTSINDYTPGVLFGYSSSFIPLPFDLNVTHRILIYASFLMPVMYFILLYKYDINHRRAFLTFIAFNVFFSYIAIRRYDNAWSNIYGLPLHLCNTAMYIIPLTLVFKSTKVFYFTMFINVIGAFLAILLPDYSENLGALDPYIIEFYINHLYAFFMPILIVFLGVYERPKFKYFGYSMIGFFGYFALCVTLNTIYGTNFFFLGNTFIVDKLGNWALELYQMFSVTFEVNGTTYTIYYLYLILFYLIYVGFAFGMWYIYELLFKGVDGLVDLYNRNVKFNENKLKFLKLQEERGIDMKKKMNLEELKNVEASLVITSLDKKYGKNDFYTIKDFSLSLAGGKIYGFLGKNGAGKSTIIKSIVGMHTFDGGKIEVCGFDNVNQEVEAKSLIGFVPDHYALYESLTGRQYINYIADLYDVSKEDRDARLADLLPRLDLDTKFDKQIKTYSHGMKQKIVIIAALIHDPKIWILDEPMTGVDPISIFQIKECMKEHARKGNIVFFSSHLIDVVKNLCDEIVMIRHGELVYRDSMENLNKNNIDLEILFLEKTKDNENEKVTNLALKEEGNL